MSDKKKYLKITHNGSADYLITPPFDNSFEIPTDQMDLENYQVGDYFTVEVVERTEEEVKELREFDGF